MTARKPPGPFGQWFARAPIQLYRLGLGRLLGSRFVLVEHVGRVSGLPRRTVLEVVDRDQSTLAVAAAWGRRSDWFRNIVAAPGVKVTTGRLSAAPATAVVLDGEAAIRVFERYADRHPRAAAALGKALDLELDDAAEVASVVPVVRFTLDD